MCAGVGERLGHGALGDLVKDHALRAFRLQARRLLHMPGDGLALAVGVGGQIDLLGSLRGLGQFLHHRPRAFVAGHDVDRLEVILDIDRKLGFVEVAHMPHRGLDGIALAQIAADRARLGRRFDDHQFAAAGAGVGALFLDVLLRAVDFFLVVAFFCRRFLRVFFLGAGAGFLQTFMRRRIAHAEEIRAADRAVPARARRPIGREHRRRIHHFSFCLTLYAISFHRFSLVSLLVV